MSRFYRPTHYDRRGPAPQAPTDGREGAYSATVHTVPDTSGNAKVIIPDLSLEHFELARCKITVAVGDVVLVIFDQDKHPWVVA